MKVNTLLVKHTDSGEINSLADSCPVNVIRQVNLLVDRGMSWNEALKRFESLRGNSQLAGFYKTRNAMHNKYYYLLVTPHTSTHFKIARYMTALRNSLSQEL